MTTLDDFARGLNGAEACEGARVTALVLAGERERATEIVNDIERSHSDHDYWKDWIKATRTFLERDIASVCAEFHAREAATAKELKLGDIWGAIAVSGGSARSGTHDKVCGSILCDDALDQPATGVAAGTARGPWRSSLRRGHAVSRRSRDHVGPLSREAAEEKHRNYQNYTLVATAERRQPPHSIVSYRPKSARPQQPKNAARVPYLQLNLELHSSSRITRASFSGHRNYDRLLDLYYVDALDHGTRRSIWSCSFSPKDNKKTIWDETGGKPIRTVTALTEEERVSVLSPIPAFGQFEGILQRVEEILTSSGHGLMDEGGHAVVNGVASSRSR